MVTLFDTLCIMRQAENHSAAIVMIRPLESGYLSSKHAQSVTWSRELTLLHAMFLRLDTLGSLIIYADMVVTSTFGQNERGYHT